MALGEEAVGVLAGIAFKLLKCIRADDIEICTDGRDQYTPSNPDSFRQLSMAVLKCCSSLMVRIFDSSITSNPSTVPLVIPTSFILFYIDSGHFKMNPLYLLKIFPSFLCTAPQVNEFSAQAFADVGGLSLLASIARQSPQLPPSSQTQLMSCFVIALKHIELLPKLIEPPEVYTDESGSYATDVSVYQTLVLAMGNMRESAPAVNYCREALHWSALADSFSAFCVFSEGLSESLAIIAEAACHRVATTHKTPAGGEREEEDRLNDDEEDRDGENDFGKAQDCGMTKACSLLHDLALTGNIAVQSMLSTLRTYLLLEREKSFPTSRTKLSVYELFQNARLIPSLAALTALSQGANELSSLCEWNTPLRDSMESDAGLCRQAVVATVSMLLKLDDGLGLLSFASNSAAVHLIWQYLSKDESVMSSQSMDELLMLPTDSCSSNGFLSLHPSSVGWIIWFAAQATSIADSIISAANTVEALEISLDPVRSPSKQRPTGGEREKQLALAQSKLFEGVEALNNCTYSTVGCSVVVNVVSHFCLEILLAVATISSRGLSGSSSSIVSSASRLVLLCALSGELTAIQAISIDSMRDKVTQLAVSISIGEAMSLSSLEQSVAITAAALAKQSSKTIDPRHKTAKFEIIRAYTDDVRVLAHRFLLRSPSIVPVVAAEVESEASTSQGNEANLIKSQLALVERCKLVVKDFSIGDREENNANRGSILKRNRRMFPSLCTAVNTLLASIMSASNAGGEGEGDSQAIALDGELLHGLLKALDIIYSVVQASELARMRYGEIHPPALDALIFADMVKGIPSQGALKEMKCLTSGAGAGAAVVEANSVSGVVAVTDTVAEGESASIALRLSDLMAETEVCLDTLRACMCLLLELVRAVQSISSHENISISNPNPLLDRVLDVAMEGRSAAISLMGEDKAGSLGSSVREICTLSVGLVGLFCPQSSELDSAPTNSGDLTIDDKSSNGNSKCKADAVVAYIAKRAVDRPATMSSNISLLIELLPSAVTHRTVDGNTIAASNATAFDVSVKDGGESSLAALRSEQADDSRSLFQLWEHFIWHKNESILSEESLEEIEKREEKEKEEDLFKGSGSMVVPDDPLYTDLKLINCTDDGSRVTILTLILFAIGSSSWEMHRLVTVLCAKCMCLGSKSASRISRAIVHTVQRRAALHLDFSIIEEEEKEKEKEFAPELSLCRLFMLLDALCAYSAMCLALVQEGLLLPVLQSLRGSSDRNVCILAMQLVSTVHRTLLKITSQQDRTEANTNNGIQSNTLIASSSIKNNLLWVIHALSDALVQTLPLALVSFQDTSYGVLLWEQTVLSMTLLPSSAVKRIIESISSTITLEGLAVKLWLAFEDSYQQLFEVTELIKLCQAHPEESTLQDLAGPDCGQGALQSAHILYTGAACALRAVIDFALMAFLEGTIALPTLAKACRCSLSDPKRVVLRYQRAYTMWAVQTRQTSTAANSSGTDAGRGWKRSAVYAPFVSGSVTDPQCSAAFDARHELISSALRSSVESTGRVAKLVSGREVRPKGGTGIIKRGEGDSSSNGAALDSSPTISSEFDFYRPFGDRNLSDVELTADATSLWFADNPPSMRLPRLCALRMGSSSDTLHTVLRRGMLYGDDLECSLFDRCVAVRLEAVHSTLISRPAKRKQSDEDSSSSNAKKLLSCLEVKAPQMPTFSYAPPAFRPTTVPMPVPPVHIPKFPGGNVPPPPPPSFPPHHQPQQPLKQQQHMPQLQQQHQQQLQNQIPSRIHTAPEFQSPSAATKISLPPPPLPPMLMRPNSSQQQQQHHHQQQQQHQHQQQHNQQQQQQSIDQSQQRW